MDYLILYIFILIYYVIGFFYFALITKNKTNKKYTNYQNDIQMNDELKHELLMEDAF